MSAEESVSVMRAARKVSQRALGSDSRPTADGTRTRTRSPVTSEAAEEHSSSAREQRAAENALVQQLTAHERARRRLLARCELWNVTANRGVCQQIAVVL